VEEELPISKKNYYNSIDINLMTNQVSELVTNTFICDKQYAAIIGLTPSKGARSPILWNAAFEAANKSTKMYPLDVIPENLTSLMSCLADDADFIGGAVTMPYKEDVAKWLGNNNMTEEAIHIGAVNSLFRNKNGELFGTNTDGEAALRSFEARYGDVKNKKILLMGPGGAGKATAAYFSKAVGPSGKLSITGRLSSEKGRQLVCALGASEWIEWGDMTDVFREIDVLINCTSIGFELQIESSPVNDSDIRLLTDKCVVFDVIYRPSQTKLMEYAIKRGLDVLNGSEMNLEQAVLAYCYATNALCDKENVRRIMNKMI